jgi:hypothetical protein
VNVWVGKEVGPELDVLAEVEARESGHVTTRIGLAREIFLWAFGVYKKVGSLARLKSSYVVTPSARHSIEAQRRAFEALERLFKIAPSTEIDRFVHQLTENADKPWAKAEKRGDD